MSLSTLAAIAYAVRPLEFWLRHLLTIFSCLNQQSLMPRDFSIVIFLNLTGKVAFRELGSAGKVSLIGTVLSLRVYI